MSFPSLRSSATSRYRVGRTIRPLASRVTFAAPRNMDGQATEAHFSPLFPTCRHYRNAGRRGQAISHEISHRGQSLTDVRIDRVREFREGWLIDQQVDDESSY